MTRVLRGPAGVRLVLDPTQIIDGDPGDGTPAVVHYEGGASTYWAAVGENEVLTEDGAIDLPHDVVEWLIRQQPAIESMFSDHYGDNYGG
jgi:hypothetical protein